MATDQTAPRLRLIATIAVIVIITLVGLQFVFKSYFAFMTDEAKYEKMAPRTALLAQLAVEREAFAGAKLPMAQAMNQVGTGARPAIIEAQPSEDLGAMTGWAKLPKPAPKSERVEPMPTIVDSGVSGDGGAPADGGALKVPAVNGALAPLAPHH
jgi:hypothetical protein